MTKVSVTPTNDFCPQQLFLHGTYGEDGKPHFGLFCWFSYYWNEGEVRVMAAIGSDCTTLQNIRRSGMFSASPVTQALLPFADRMGNIPGTDPAKMDVEMELGRGAVLDVPVLNQSLVTMELALDEFLPTTDGGILRCTMKNVLMDARLRDESLSLSERMAIAAPVLCTHESYFFLDPKRQSGWGEVYSK